MTRFLRRTGGRVFLLALGGAAASAIAAGAELHLALGTPLVEALRQLEASGLRLVWSDLLVTPEMVVVAGPDAVDPETIVDEILRPHGLAIERRGSTLVVVRSTIATAILRGAVRASDTRAPLAGAEVRLVDDGRAVLTDAQGRFYFSGLVAGLKAVEARIAGYVIEEAVAVELRPSGIVEVELVLRPAPLAAEEIVVQPSRLELLVDEPASPLSLSREEIESLPHLAGDVFRALDLLPGIAGTDDTAEIHVRGGRRDENVVRLDGQEIYDAYHLKEYDNALSIVPSAILERVDVSTGALPASLGDRLGGAIELTTFPPSNPRRYRLAASLIDLQFEAAGRSADARLGGFASARYGSGALAGALFGEEQPSFWDVFLKGTLAVGDRQSLRASYLASTDRLELDENASGESRRFATEYGGDYAWVDHDVTLSERLLVGSALSFSSFDRERRGAEDEEEKRFDVADERDTRIAGLSQRWDFAPGWKGSPALSAGFEGRRYDSSYTYTSQRLFFSPLAQLRAEPRDGRFDRSGELRDEAVALWLSDRFRPRETLTLELGARYDGHDRGDGPGAADETVTPRAAIAWAVGSGVLRFAWGRQAQTQRTYELMIPDGDTTFYRAEVAEQASAGWERPFSSAESRVFAGVRLEAYSTRIDEPRPRYESLFEPFEPFVEGELDRRRIEPKASRMDGVELFVRGRPAGRASWWVNYTIARTEDRLNGRWSPRLVDQRHTANATLALELGAHWSASFAFRFHTGRPTTPLHLDLVPIPHDDGEDGGDGDDDEDDDGEESATAASHELDPVPVLGPINSQRLPAYHRLDVRLSRSWELARGRLTFFADAQNLYNRRNVAGYDLELDDSETAIVRAEETGIGFLATAGVSWEF